MITPVHTASELSRVAGGDPLIVWAGQGLRGARAWRLRDSVVVAAPDLSRRDRLAVLGSPDDLAELTAYAIGEVGPSYRPFGDEAVVRGLANRLAGLEFSASFGWMDTTVAPVVEGTAKWLGSDDGVAELLATASPNSYAWPGRPGVRRWAGVAEGNGLLSVAADAWSAPEIAFLAGVATAPATRGHGLSRAVCGFVTAELVREHGSVGLMVDDGNEAAIGLYLKLGFGYRGVAAASMTPG